VFTFRQENGHACIETVPDILDDNIQNGLDAEGSSEIPAKIIQTRCLDFTNSDGLSSFTGLGYQGADNDTDGEERRKGQQVLGI